MEPPGLSKNNAADLECGQRSKLRADLELQLPPTCFLSVPQMLPVLEDLWIPPFFQLRLPFRFLGRSPDLQLYPFPCP